MRINCYKKAITKIHFKNAMTQDNRYTKKDSQAEAYKNKTLQDIEALKVPANPIHYSLLYEKNCYLDPDLAREVDLLVKSGHYSDETIKELYNLYLKKQLNSSLPTEDIQLLINSSLKDINNWTKESSDSRSSLQQNLKMISVCTNEEETLTCINHKIIPPIEKLNAITLELEKKLQESSATINTLTAELERVTSLAKTDSLTGIPNRRGFDEILLKHIEQSLERNQSFALLIVDIDHFKQINDQFGHLVGDSVLRNLSRTLQDLSKGQDSIARYGGEEFVLLLTDINYKNALNFADKLRNAVAKKKFIVSEQKAPLTFTISVGVSIYQINENPENLFTRADKALYLAKESGRNQTRGEHQI